MRPRTVLLPALAVLAAALWFSLGKRLPAPAPAPERVRVPKATAAARAVASAPTPVPPEVRRTTVVVPWEPARTPSPTQPEPTATATPRPEPTATPAVQECVAIRWSSGMSPVSIAQVLVEVHAVNRCGRDLAPLEVWFEVAGFRRGDLIQATRGHLLDPLPRDGEGHATIALAGSADWYDEISVAVVPLIDR